MWSRDEVLWLIEDFNTAHKANFYELNRTFFFDLPEELEDYRILTDQDVTDIPKDIWTQYVQFFEWKKSSTSKVGLEHLHLRRSRDESMQRVLWFKRWTTSWNDYDLLVWLMDEQKLREVFCDNPKTCWNLFALNNKRCPSKIPCIFKPSRYLVKSYDFIEPEKVTGSFKVKRYWIDVKRLREYDTISITPQDIKGFYYWALDPFIWVQIVNRNYNALLCDLKI